MGSAGWAVGWVGQVIVWGEGWEKVQDVNKTVTRGIA